MPVVTPNFVYPTNMELSTIDQVLLPVLTASNPIWAEFPIRERDTSLVVWEQMDDFFGLMQARSVDGSYPSVPHIGETRFEKRPSHYGEYYPIPEKEMEDRRRFGSVNEPINVEDLTVAGQKLLAHRHYNRMANTIWTLVTTGVYQIFSPNGALVDTDKVNLLTYNSPVNIGLPATAAPLSDLRTIKLKHRGQSANFDGRATVWANMNTCNQIVANSNLNDLGGRRGPGLETIEGVGQLNTLLMKDGLPNLVEYDMGFKGDDKVWRPFIPDNVAVVIGRRENGAPLGEFTLTRNASNGNSSAPLVKVVTKGLGANEPPPAKIEVYRGFNGGPKIDYGSAIVVWNVNPN